MLLRPTMISLLSSAALLLHLLAGVHANRQIDGNVTGSSLAAPPGYLRKGEWQHRSDRTSPSINVKDQIPLATAILPLMGVSGSHHVHVYVGSPPQRQTLIVDTGSRLMAFPCNPCRNCGKHSSPYFEPEVSSTDRIPTCGNCLLDGLSSCSKFSNNKLGKKCILQQQYTEGSSWTAFEIEDMVWVGSAFQEDRMEEWMRQLAVPYPFGCQTSESGLFRKQHADGILGLAVHPTSLIQQFAKHGSIAMNAFSLCLTKADGVWNLGGTEPSYHEEEMKFTPQSRDHGWYAATVMEVKLGGNCVACDENTHIKAMEGGKGTIFDSGTTDTYLPKQLAPHWERIWKELTGFPYAKRKRKYTYDEFITLPILEIIFDGNVTLQVGPVSYMEHVPAHLPWSGSRELINRIYVDEPEGAVLGANTMFGYDILFDNANNRIGLAKARCGDMGYHQTTEFRRR